MTFSHTQPLVLANDGDAELDPLYEAWSVVREARRVPVDLGIDIWAREIRAMLERVEAAVSAHIDTMEADDSPLMARLRSDPEDSRAVQEQVAEHARLTAAAAETLHALDRPELGNGEVVAVAERLIELEIALARHLNRLHEIFGRQPWHAPTR